MPRISDAQILPPKNWEEFEDICFDLWKTNWKDPNTHKNGRKGQPQAGVDIYGRPSTIEGYAGVQCKGKDNYLKSILTEEEINKEVNKAKTFKPPLKVFIIATTQPRDVQLQEYVRLQNEINKSKGLFDITIFFWEDIQGELGNQKWILKKYWPQFFIKEETSGAEPTGQLQIDKKINIEVEHISIKQEGITINNLYYLNDSVKAVITEKYNSDIDFARDLVINHKPGEAIPYLNNLKNRIWGEANHHLKFRISTNLASSHFSINEIDTAAKMYIEALQYNPNDEKALTNCALGYLLLKDYYNAQKYSKSVLEKSPSNGRAFSIYLQSIAPEKDIEGLENEIPVILKEDPEVLHSLGFLCRVKGDFGKAEFYLEKAFTNDKEHNVELMNSYATIILEKITKDNPIIFGLILNNKEFLKLKSALELLNKVWDKYQDLKLRIAKIGVLINRSVLKRILKDFWGAISDIDEVIRVEGEKPEYVQFKALLSIEIQDIPLAIRLLEKIHLNDKVPESDLILAELLDKKNNVTKAISVLEPSLQKLSDTDLKIDFIASLVNLYIKNKNLRKAEELAHILFKENPENVNSLIAISLVQKAKGDIEGGNNKLKEAVRYCKDIKDKFLLTEELYENEFYNEAALLYESFVNTTENNRFTKQYLASLYNSGNLGKALEIAKNIRVKYQPLKFITEIEIGIYDRIGALNEAITIATEYLSLYPDDLRMKIRRAFICLRKRDFVSVDEFLSSITLNEYLTLPLEYLQKLSLLFSERGNSLESLNILYETRRTFFNLPDAHMIYIGGFFSRESEVDEYLKTPAVTINCAIKIKDRSNIEKWYIIENREKSNFSNNEINLDHPLAKELLNKKNGDSISIQCRNNEVYIILEIKSKYIYALHESLTLYPQLFPERSDLQGITLAPSEDKAGGELNFEPIFNQIDRLNEHTKQGERLYLTGLLTIGGLSRYIGQDIFKVITGLMSKKNLGIRCCLGNVDERITAINNLNKTKYLVIDILSLLFVQDCDIVKPLLEVYEKIFIPQSVIDLLNETISLKRSYASRGFITIGKEEGQYVKEEINATKIHESIEFYENLISYVENNFSVEPCKEALNISASEKSKLDRIFLPHFFEAVLLAKEKNALLFTDDNKLRQLAFQKYAVNGVWSQLVLMTLLDKDKILKDQFEEFTIKLAVSNYYHTSISVDTIIKSLEKTSWNVSSPFQEVADVLNGKNSDFISAISVVVGFLNEIKDKLVSIERRRNILFILLNKLSSNRNHKLVIDRLITELNSAFYLLPLYHNELLQDIEAWTKIYFN